MNTPHTSISQTHLNRSRNRSRSIRIVALALFAAIRPVAQAEVIVADWSDEEHFSYQIQYMPDLDQNRGGLPGSGSMFCVPTATMNMFAYAAEWGFETLPPGPGVYQGDLSHQTMSNHLEDLGEMMNTGTDGTGLNAWLSGSQEWIDGYNLVRTADYRSGDYCPTASTAAHAAACGSLVAICYGRFQFNPSSMPVVADSPDSGHCVTMMRAYSNGPDSLEMWVRDPGDSNDSIWSQSPWAYRIYNPIENMHIQHDWDGNGYYEPHEVTVLEYNPDSEKIRILYKVYQITPAFGYSFDTIELNFEAFGGFDLTGGTHSTHFNPPSGFQILSAGLHPNLHSYILLQQGPPNEPAALVLADRANGQKTEMFHQFHLNLLTVGRNRDLYVYGNGVLRRLDIDNPEDSDGDGDLEWQEIKSFNWNRAAQALAYDDEADEVIAISTSERRMLVAPQSLGSEVEPVSEYVLPSLVPTGVDAADYLFWQRSGGTYGVLLAGDQLFLLELHNPGPDGFLTADRIILADNPEPESIAFDDHGNLLLTHHLSGNEYEVREYKYEENSSSWIRVAQSRYADVVAGKNFRVARSRSNFDRDINANDEIAIPVDELPEIGTAVFDCPGDLDNSGAVDFDDFTNLLALFGSTCPCLADLDNDNDVDFDDFVTLLANWGPCE